MTRKAVSRQMVQLAGNHLIGWCLIDVGIYHCLPRKKLMFRGMLGC
jgi:hypothetical protein